MTTNSVNGAYNYAAGYQYGAFPKTLPKASDTPVFGKKQDYEKNEGSTVGKLAKWTGIIAAGAIIVDGIFCKFKHTKNILNWAGKKSGLSNNTLVKITEKDGNITREVSKNGKLLLNTTETAADIEKCNALKAIYNDTAKPLSERAQAYKDFQAARKAIDTEGAKKVAIANAKKGLAEGSELTAEQIAKIEKEAADKVTARYAKFEDKEKLQKFFDTIKDKDYAKEIEAAQKKLAETTEEAAKKTIETEIKNLQARNDYKNVVEELLKAHQG